MMRIILTLWIFGLSATSVQSQSPLEYLYTMYFGPDDYYNSNGTRLTDVCAIVQQDRANYHNFGIQDEWDEGDTVFDTAEMRAQIPSMCLVGQGVSAENVLSGKERFMAISVRRLNNGEIYELVVGYRPG